MSRTISDVVTLARILTATRRDGPLESVRHAWHTLRAHVDCRRLGIRRLPTVDLSDVGIEDPRCHQHAPTNYAEFRRAMRGTRVDPRCDVFVDYGSGMGAAVIMAARYRFKRVVGVEISPEFDAVARELVDRLRPRLRCKNIELVVSDATRYALPEDATVVYLYNPFEGEILAAVLADVRESIRRRPRPLTLIVKNSEHLAAVPELDEWAREERRFRCFPNHECVVFRCGPGDGEAHG